MADDLFRVICIVEGPDGPHGQPLSIWFQGWARAEQELRRLQRQPEYAHSRLTISSLADLRRAKEHHLAADSRE